MSLVHEIICESVKTRDMDSLNKALQIVFPDRMENKELVVYEYDGSVPRLFGDDRHIELMLPEDMDEIVENAVVDAIENGTLFDDADHVKNAATYITMTKLPVNGMVNRGIDEPVGMKHAVGSVVGAMNSDGRFGADEEDIENGKNFVHDIVDHGDEDNARDLVASYIDAKDHNKLPIEFRRSLKDLGKEIDDVKSVKPEDSISSSDLDDGLDMKKVKEMGSIGDDGVDDVEECGCQCVKEEDGGEMEPGETPTTPTSVETEDANEFDDEKDIVNESSNENKWETLENMLGRKLPEDFKNGIDDRNDIANHFQGSVYSKYDFGIADACNVDDIIKYRKDNNNYLENDDYLHFAGDGWGNSLILMYHPKSKSYSYALWYHDQFEGDNHKTIIIGKTWKDMRSKFKNEDIKESYIDTEEIYKTYIEEGFLRRPKKLKPIPRDVVAYITVEINAVGDANDQAMLAGYTCAKLELVDFYITCLDTNDDRYIVPHNRQYLVQMQNDLNRLLTRILQLRPVNKSDRMWKVNVTLPEGR